MMRRLTILQSVDGMHSGESLVEIETRDGKEELFVDAGSVHGNTIPVGYPISSDRDQVLVELPRETMRGNWRVWVGKGQLREG